MSSRYHKIEDLESFVPHRGSSDAVADTCASPPHRNRGLVIALLALVSTIGVLVGAGRFWSADAADADTLERWLPFDATSADPLQSPVPSFDPSLSERVFIGAGDDCAFKWIAHGDLCAAGARSAIAAEQSPLAVVWTWVGRSERLAFWRSSLAGGVRPNEMPERKRTVVGSASHAASRTQARHFREHGELRASMRSARLSLQDKASFTLVTTDLPTADGLNDLRVGQIPPWLDASPGSDVRVVHHFDLFKAARSTLSKQRLIYADDEAALRTAALEWRDAALPTFDSLSIESQLGHLDSSAEVMLYLNDDSFLLRPMTISDFHTPVFGPVLRVQENLLVAPTMVTSQPSDDREGEWPGLGFSSALLCARFGERRRPYVVHQGKVLIRPMLEEVQHVWADEHADSASIRFRGRGIALNTPFLVTHYNIERHRELLLYSFFVLRADPDRSGDYTLAERSALVAEIKLGVGKDSLVAKPIRSSLSRSLDDLDSVGLDRRNATEYTFSSADGYPWIELPFIHTTPENACRLDVDTCFGPSDSSPFDTFKHFAYERTDCGDCLVQLLVGRSGERGLSAFLPETDPLDPISDRWRPAAWPKDWRDSALASHFPDSATATRAQIATLLLRYSYTLGATPSAFISMASLAAFGPELERLDANDETAFLTINDDVAHPQFLDRYDVILNDWYDRRFPEAAPWETDRNGHIFSPTDTQ